MFLLKIVVDFTFRVFLSFKPVLHALGALGFEETAVALVDGGEALPQAGGSACKGLALGQSPTVLLLSQQSWSHHPARPWLKVHVDNTGQVTCCASFDKLYSDTVLVKRKLLLECRGSGQDLMCFTPTSFLKFIFKLKYCFNLHL